MPRPPSIDQGITSFLWAFGLGVFIWAGLLAVGVSQATAVIVAAVSFCAIFLFVRLQGEDEPKRQRAARGRGR
jgi:membrane protein implicated in regulation of membrane protease activity